MYGMNRRLKKVEDKLNLNEEHITVNVVYFGGGELPPDRTNDNITVHHVAYEDVRR